MDNGIRVAVIKDKDTGEFHSYGNLSDMSTWLKKTESDLQTMLDSGKEKNLTRESLITIAIIREELDSLMESYDKQ